MTSFALKLIAIVSMLLDHIGAILFPDVIALRYIGRLAFPIFCFLLVEGYYHTSNVKKYLLRLGIFAAISEVPFDLAFRGRLFDLGYQNVFFTLFLGLTVIWLMDEAVKKLGADSLKSKLFRVGFILVGCLLAELLHTDYSATGVLVIVFFYMLRDNKTLLTILIALFLGSDVFYGGIEYVAVLSMIPILKYNGKKGPGMKYFFYVFYPAHLLILVAIRTFLM
ncbi:TraX family protein [Anaerolentibacter hominis]|uniref:TraX family protein n=1 Tax=Anaerolentibacter hominis TaxID=3079009 RepID=UPI0031B88D09